jgi:acetyl-CoA carboxylase biotin carboxyl carrier protein
MNLEDLQRLLELMDKHELIEVEMEDPEQGTRIRLRKAPPPSPIHPVIAPTLVAADPGRQMMAVPVAPGSVELAPEPAPEEDSGNLEEVPSPLVGTFYRASSPEADVFAEVGDAIEDETVVCIIEAMKVMNEVKAEVAGEIVEILVQNGEAVEFGQPLFVIRTE